MARAIIHNSDYQSVEFAKEAIDRYITDRNKNYLENPKRAGKKYGEKKEQKLYLIQRITARIQRIDNCLI